jgi:hypothetical protein
MANARVSCSSAWVGLVGAVLAGIPFTSPALAACGDEARIQCRAEFETMAAIARSGDGFSAVGWLKSNPQSGVALIRLTRTGAPRGNLLPIPLPANLPASVSAAPRKLLALPNGDVVLLGDITITEAQVVRQVGWAARIAANDRIVWNRTYPDSPNTTIFHSGLYEANGDKVILVGRRTSGADPASRCEFWSQSLILPVAAATGNPLGQRPITFGDQNKSFTNRQAIYDIIPGERAGSYVVTGFQTAKNAQSDTCQDNIFVAALSAQSDIRWTSQAQSFGSPIYNELAVAIRPAGSGRYLVAGQGRDETKGGAPAAQAYRVRMAAPPVEALLNTPYPADGSDKTGGDRYRVIVPLPDRGRFLLAGSVSASREGNNRAMWQIVSPDLRTNGNPQVLNSPGSSDILDAVLTPDNKVLAVGKWTDEGRSIGWVGFIGDADAPSTAARRPPDRNLPRLTQLPATNGVMQLPDTALSTGAAFFENNVTAGTQYDLALTVSRERTIKISAYTESGDVDLVILDSNRKPIEFTNFKQSAAEFMVAALVPGEYLISMVVQTRVPSLELRLGPATAANANVTTKLQALSDQQRAQFASTLATAGYNPPSNPDISLGGETVRALLAIQEGAQREVDPIDIAKYIVP